ncbi:hypothetical protein BASA50_001846 [Batrachochytrium salamandrivorans]|uniref:Cytosol aminopeptidase domain-containing protein n=1 Tax=Batrachochytrium salamandrivorans TaxID=1357716 RepID=A0ABQ8FN80_9FUNG|nr:hypothetical protein BASA62_008684 [Batrachochytrium salamandrivorans]KAH6582095.1 hypothetical protein BASA60_002146 [Batrachochytrium salamandrivorans]KAH6591186.1 hypothetical protein BASA61_005040 [Batrachochytrium salamandrivorans]KAH6601167.1 hypothetical protein BASA50_001846 [Batrachochytrium salamandrivorans]KAH9246965.1 hypothetical protein BASA81_015450 [Batrachochytrium salamandrivorans]
MAATQTTPVMIPISLESSDGLSALAGASDGLILIRSSLTSLETALAQTPLLAGSTVCSAAQLQAHITAHMAADLSAASPTAASLIVVPGMPGNRILLSPVVSLLGDTDDVRRYADAARTAIVRARAAGMLRPTVMLLDSPLKASHGTSASSRIERDFHMYLQVVLMGFMYEIYEPLQTREHRALATSAAAHSFSEIRIGAVDTCVETVQKAIQWAQAVDTGRSVARDMGGADPERMAPLRCAEYIEAAFKGIDNIKVTIVRDVDVIKREYPLLHAVTRCSLAVPDHFPAVVRLEYLSPEPAKVKENLFFIGKGVTYDTGGADIKHDGHMRGMSRDKCGATACAGFMKTVSLLKPTGVNVVATLGFVRNSVGAHSYVSDEIMYSRSGVRVLIGNTDAEGRMVMADLLAEAKECALSSPTFAAAPSRLFTVATLTGHAVVAVGEGYSISLDNGPARESGISDRLFKAGHACGDPFETSTLRREDYSFIQPTSSTEDVCQANSLPSSRTPRGHQFPAAFLAISSGIVGHGLESKHPIAYTHVDIAGSAEESLGGLSLARVTGSPVAAFTAAFLG